MNKENYLERIALALETLVSQGNSLSADFSHVVEAEPTAPEKEQPKAQVQLTSEDLKAVCLTVARAGKKDEVKAVIASYGVTKSIDVPLDKIAECISKIEKLA